MRTALAICAHDLARFFRNPGRVLNIPLLPLIVIVCLGTGWSLMLRAHTAVEGHHYQEWIVAGVVANVLMYSAKSSASVMLRDREIGLLNVMLLCSARSASVILGKVLSGTLQCLAYGFAMLAMTPFLGLHLNAPRLAAALVVLTVGSLMIVSVFHGLAIASPTYEHFSRNSQTLSLATFFLAGSVFPITHLAGILGWLAWANPVTYVVDGLRVAILPAQILQPYGPIRPFIANLEIVTAFGMAAAFLLVARFPRWAGMR